MLHGVREDVAERLREAAPVDAHRRRLALPLEGGVPGPGGGSGQRGQLDPFRAGRPAAATVSPFFIYVMHNVDTVAGARALEILQTGLEPVELRVEHLGVLSGCWIPPNRLTRKPQGSGGAPKLVLGAGNELGIRSPIPHTASVSL